MEQATTNKMSSGKHIRQSTFSIDGNYVRLSQSRESERKTEKTPRMIMKKEKKTENAFQNFWMNKVDEHGIDGKN